MAAPRERRGVALAALGAYLVGVVVLTAGPWGGALNRLVVFLYVFFRTDVPVAPDWAIPEHYGVLLNVLLVVPPALGAVLLGSWSWWRVTLAAAAASATVELLQATWLARVGTWTDVVANAAGGLVGALVGELVLIRRARGRRPRGPRAGA